MNKFAINSHFKPPSSPWRTFPWLNKVYNIRKISVEEKNKILLVK